MTPRTLTATALIAWLAALGACSSTPSIDSSYDYNTSLDFTGYRTYAFISEHPMAVSQTQGPVSPLLEGRLMESVRIAMNTKGYNEVDDPERADVAIGFSVGARDQIKVDTYPATFQTGFARRGYYYGYGYNTETRVRQYTEGTLAVDLFDVASHTPAFHGIASTRINDAARKDQQTFLNAVAAEALSAFPSAGGRVAAPD